MAQTQRTFTQLESILADNATHDISATDLRDLMESLRAGHGEISITSTAATSFTDATSFVQAAGTYALTGGLSHNWAMATNARLNYTGTQDRMVHIAATVSMVSSSNNQTVEWAVAKNGTVLTPSITSRKIGQSADVGSTAIHGFTMVSAGDYISVMVKNTSWTAAETVTANYLNLFVMSMMS